MNETVSTDEHDDDDIDFLAEAERLLAEYAAMSDDERSELVNMNPHSSDRLPFNVNEDGFSLGHDTTEGGGLWCNGSDTDPAALADDLRAGWSVLCDDLEYFYDPPYNYY